MARLRIKEVAEAQGIKQSHLQIKAAVTPPLLNRYWNNKTNTVSLNDLEKIAKALGVKTGDLITDQEEASGNEDGEDKEGGNQEPGQNAA